jgi:hypothetical protein
MPRTHITLDAETQERARQRATEMGLSFAEYVRRLVARDVGAFEPVASAAALFDLGSSGDSDIARNKDSMIAEALGAAPPRHRRRR